VRFAWAVTLRPRIVENRRDCVATAAIQHRPRSLDPDRFTARSGTRKGHPPSRAEGAIASSAGASAGRGRARCTTIIIHAAIGGAPARLHAKDATRRTGDTRLFAPARSAGRHAARRGRPAAQHLGMVDRPVIAHVCVNGLADYRGSALMPGALSPSAPCWDRQEDAQDTRTGELSVAYMRMCLVVDDVCRRSSASSRYEGRWSCTR